MSVVVDTNALVSGALEDKPPPALAVRWVDRHGIVLKSMETERQLLDAISRPYLARLIESAARAWLKRLVATAEPVTDAERIVACHDHTDDKFLELAVNGKADVIVPGDADLLVPGTFRGIPIISLAAFARARVG